MISAWAMLGLNWRWAAKGTLQGRNDDYGYRGGAVGSTSGIWP